MIPKVIHYIWLGGAPLSPLIEKCIESWKKQCPDYEIKRWDESNLDIGKYKFAKEAYDAKNWAFASDVFRYDVLYNNGGIYLDTDVELLKPLDEFLKYNFFAGFEDDETIGPGLIMGSEKHSQVTKDMLEVYKNTEFTQKNCYKKTICVLTTDYFVNKFNLQKKDELQLFDNERIAIFPTEYFCPMSYKTRILKVTDKTVSIHHYAASWVKKPFWVRWWNKLFKKRRKI